jgi:DNA-binding transcriptional LysR family regulator
VLQILGDVAEADLSAMSKSESAAGTLHIYSHLSFGETQLSRLLSAFKRECADVALDVTVSDRTMQLVDEGFDIGFFLSMQKFGSTMIARQLGVAEVILCASPDYIARHGEPQTPDDLVHHCCLNFSSEYLRNRWTTEGTPGAFEIPIKSAMVSNNGELLRQCAAEAMGILMRPSFALHDDLTTGRLVRVLSNYQFASLAVSMVYPSRRHLPAKLKRFVEFVSQRFPCPEIDPWSAGTAQESDIPAYRQPDRLIAMKFPKDIAGPRKQLRVQGGGV